MPFFVNTPESLLDRSDSKNPSTTCRGLTASGRPCRRAVTPAGAPSRARALSISRLSAVHLRADDPRDAMLYCWQHKEQANHSTHSSPGPRMSGTPVLEERTSLDTVAERLGLVMHKAKPKKPRRLRQPKPTATEKPGSMIPAAKQQQYRRPATIAKPAKTVEFCCCFRIPLEEVPPPSRPKTHPLQSSASAPVPGRLYHRANSSDKSKESTSTETARYLSLIPRDASPHVASLLMSELARPLSRVDEPGYIYMFWLTPDSQPARPPVDAARSLLTPPVLASPVRPGGQRRPSDVLASFAASDVGGPSRILGPMSTSGAAPNRKILLKIGRATNVQRRLNEWTRQCGYNLSLIRFYPYISSASPSGLPRKLPHSHKVERLIHIELAGMGLRAPDLDKCIACGREHREWFEVAATRRGIADVDRIIRKWVDWDESMG